MNLTVQIDTKGAPRETPWSFWRRSAVRTIFKNEKIIFFIVCILAVFGLYGQTLKGDFVLDDRGLVQHAEILTLANFEQTLQLPYWEPSNGLYRPASLFSYALNYSLFGPKPFSFHLINLLLYALTVYVFYLLVKKLFARANLAMLSALLFLVLPIHTEVVANIIGRAEILALLFSLCALLLIAKDKLKDSDILLAGLCTMLAVGSKENAIAVVPLALLVMYLKDSRLSLFQSIRQRFWLITAILIGAGAYLAARFLVLGKYFLAIETSQVENPLLFAAPIERIATALKILVMYLSKTFWPVNLCSDYSFNQIPLVNFWQPAVLAGLTILLFFLAVLLWIFKNRSMYSLAAGFFLLAFLPISNLFFPTGTIAGERLMYFPSVGICLLLAGALDWIRRRRTQKNFFIISWLIAGALLIFYGWAASTRSLAWLTEKKLFTSAARCAPGSVLSLSNLGAVYYLEGDLVNAEKQLLAARQIYNKYTKAENNLGLVYWKTGRSKQAREQFLRAATLPNGYSGALENLGLMSLEEGNIQEAFEWFMKFYGGDLQKAEAAILPYSKKISPVSF